MGNTRRTRKATFFIAASSGANTIGYRCNAMPGNYMMTAAETVAGAGYVGAFQVGVPQIGASWFYGTGFSTELRARDAAVGAAATDELWSRVLNAGGCVRATGGASALPHTYTLGDIHQSGDVPAGDNAVLPFFGIQVDGTAATADFLTQEGDNGVTNWTLNMVAGQKPMLDFDVYGTLGDGTVSATNFTYDDTKTLATEGNAQSWYGSTCTVQASGLAAWTPVFKSYSFSPNNVIPIRADANGALGVAPMVIVERAPGGTITVEASFDDTVPATDTFMNPDHWFRNRLYFDFSATYVASAVDTAGGAITARTFTITQRAYVSGQPSLDDSNGILSWSFPFMQDETATGTAAWRISLAA